MVKQDIGVPRQACWLAQQGAEKALKGVLVFLQIDFPRSHDLDLLRTLLPEDWRLKTDPPDFAELSQWSVEARYPGDWPEATLPDALHAVALAQDVVRIVAEDMGRHGLNVEDQ
jgi:HEPN domain-containing protein